RDRAEDQVLVPERFGRERCGQRGKLVGGEVRAAWNAVAVVGGRGPNLARAARANLDVVEVRRALRAVDDQREIADGPGKGVAGLRYLPDDLGLDHWQSEDSADPVRIVRRPRRR